MMRVVVKTLLVCTVIYFSGLFIADYVINNNSKINDYNITQYESVRCSQDVNNGMDVSYCD